MTIAKKAVFSAALAGALAGSLYEIGDASAWGIRRSAAECSFDTTLPGTKMLGAKLSNETDKSVFVYCPTPEDALVSGASIKTVNVHGHNASDTELTYAAVCDVSFYDDMFGCRNYTETQLAGEFAMQLGAPKFSVVYPPELEANFKAIIIRLGKRNATTGKASTVRGVYFGG